MPARGGRPAGRARARRRGDGVLEVSAVVQLDAGAAQRQAQLGGGLAHQVGRAPALGEGRRQRAVVATLAPPAEDRVHAAVERPQADDRRGHVRGLESLT